MKIGYYLIVNPEKDLSVCIQEIRKAGAEEMVYDFEYNNGIYLNREKLLNEIKDLDTLIINELSHLVDSSKSLYILTKKFQIKSISLISLSENINTLKYNMKFSEILKIVYELDNKTSSIKTLKGLKIARESGIIGGKRKGLPMSTIEKAKECAKLYRNGMKNIDIVKCTGVSNATLFRLLKSQGVELKNKKRRIK
ncbi:MAG: recombinase family protein [Salinivirgaceae bacterium]|jgi:DNA invertase Pin-like site-specific DNA recombinase